MTFSHDHHHRCSRRDLFRYGAALGLMGGLPLPAFGNGGDIAAAANFGRTLILIELDGGNDGLNTVIPVEDDLYFRARNEAGLAIGKSQALAMTGVSDLRLHPSLSNSRALFDDGECSPILGVGYAENNRSHFRGIDIWNTGSDADTFLDSGWMGRILAGTDTSSLVAESTLQRRSGSNPIESAGARNLAMSNPEDFVDDGSELVVIEQEVREAAAGNPAYEHMISIHDQVVAAVDDLTERLTDGDPNNYTPPTFTTEFPDTGLGKQMRGIAEMIAAGVSIPVHKASFNGFDTHAGQVSSHSATAGRHSSLLEELDGAVAAFRDAMVQYGKWQDVLVLTYSEFGRRVTPNASLGTDHGGAACQFAWSGSLAGGIHGTQPSLAEDQLFRGDLVANVDFRQMYVSAAEFLGLDATLAFGAEHGFTAVPLIS